ncbi:MAG: hypothetical protein ACPL1G_09445 [Thermodesulfovibrionales bacterium]
MIRLTCCLAFTFLYLILLLPLPSCSSLHQQSQNNIPAVIHKQKSAIIDHLSISHPNQSFVKECSEILREAGYTVDYYKGEDVTVEFYRNLPAREYDLIIFRVHSTYIHKYLSLALFTSEPYTKERYVQEQMLNRVAKGFIEPYHEGDPLYLVITDKFVRYSMKGSFHNSIIIMMGCASIKKCMATAFIEKGAKAYIGWNGPVSAHHTDIATIRLLKYLLLGKKTIAEAVGETMKEVGSEPQYKNTLLYWPIEAGGLKVEF